MFIESPSYPPYMTVFCSKPHFRRITLSYLPPCYQPDSFYYAPFTAPLWPIAKEVPERSSIDSSSKEAHPVMAGSLLCHLIWFAITAPTSLLNIPHKD